MHGTLPAEAALLRVMTCGSVDDGKSTLIGRLLHETHAIMEDQWTQLAADSRRFGTTGAAPDFALLVDGLEAEREQGITIDVAYRFASTPRRRFIIADAPGHEQYTRNMATAASTADVAIVLVDAQRGVSTQTMRHSFIASLMGVRHILLAVNKMDLVGYDQAVFDTIAEHYRQSVATAGFGTITAIPISARAGDNVTSLSPATSWYSGPALLDYLETLRIEPPEFEDAFRMPVQLVSRPNRDFRGYAGTIATGRIRPGDTVMCSASRQTARIARIVTMDGDLPEAVADDAVTLVLDREIDVSRGDVLTADDVAESPADQFGAHLIWLSDMPLSPGRSYLMKLGTRIVGATVSRIRHRIDVNTRQHLQADQVKLNDVAKVNLALDAPVAWTRYASSRDLGGFILIDRQTQATAGVGMIDFPLVRAANLRWQDLDTTREARATLKGQRPVVLWFTGLSGAGKSTIANLVERRLFALGRHTYVLDGDNVRQGLNRDLGFTEADRVENIRRVGEVAALFAEAGLITIVAFISPYRAERDEARRRLPKGDFLEVFVDTSIEACIERDVKGLYGRAIAGQIPNFTGISSPYEPPLAPDIHLRTADGSAEMLAETVVTLLRDRGFLGAAGY